MKLILKQKMLNLMLKRFKVESGKTDASSIDWQLLTETNSAEVQRCFIKCLIF